MGYRFLLLCWAGACALTGLAMARQLPGAPATIESGVLQPAPSPCSGRVGVIMENGIVTSPAVFGHIGRHRDRSVAGADVILGGLVTAIFAVVACYIRVTAKKEGQEKE